MLPVTLRIGSARTVIKRRILSFLTGTRLDNEIGRIPVEESINLCLPQLLR